MTERVDLLITGATVLDGTGAPGAQRDVAVRDDRIVDASDVVAGATIEARGLVLAPGFIDVHTHDDWAVLLDPDHGGKTRQGVTSVVTGNCGVAPAPTSEGERVSRHESMAAYLADVESVSPAVNVAALAGHGTIRTAVVGLREDRAATEAELTTMRRQVTEALDAGCVGLSTGLAYEPGRYAGAEEIHALAELVAEAGGIYTSHMRNESAGLLASIDETIAVGEATGVRVQISHLKAAGRENWGTVVEALARIDDARARGVDVMADQYPYTRGSTMLEQVVRSGALDGESAFGSLTGAQILIATAPQRPDWEGRTIAELAAQSGVDERRMADEMVSEVGRNCFVVIDIMDEADVQTVMAHPMVMIGSDGVPSEGKPHPRAYHTYPRVLGEYVRRSGVLDLSTAVHRMTAMPASRFGLVDRGVIRDGAFADLVLFDPESIIDTGTYEEPSQPPVGIERVIVNGRTVVHDGEVTGARPGRVLRRS